jgi:hypothetical protein
MAASKEETFKAVQVLSGHISDMEKQVVRAYAQEIANDVAKEYAEAMRDAPTSRVFPEGWGNEQRKEGWSQRQAAAVVLIGEVFARVGGEWNPSLVRHAFGSGEGPDTWRVMARKLIANPGDKKVEGSGVIEPSDVVVAGFGAPLPEALNAMGMTWAMYAELMLQRFMKELRREIIKRNWRFPKETQEDGCKLRLAS